MKRLFALFLVFCLACVSTAAMAEYADGQYTGTGNDLTALLPVLQQAILFA